MCAIRLVVRRITWSDTGMDGVSTKPAHRAVATDDAVLECDKVIAVIGERLSNLSPTEGTPCGWMAPRAPG